MTALQRLANDQGTTDGERANARAALRRHRDRYVAAIERWRKREADRAASSGLFGNLWRRDCDRIGTAFGCWYRGPEVAPGLWRAIAPDYDTVLATICTVRKAHRCHACGETIPKGGRAWRAPVYNGNHRMHRHCTRCWAPDPDAIRQLPTTRELTP